MKIIELKATSYNSKGEAICFLDKKPFYVPGLIVNEVAKCKIQFEKDKFGRAQIVKILNKSEFRNEDIPNNHLLTGGYEIMHMNRKAQTEFKINKIKQDFKQIAKYDIKLRKMVIGEKQLRYRNKITLHDGGFYEVGTHKVVKMNDFLLTDIRPKTKLRGEVVIRKLNSIIEGHKKDKLYTFDKMMGLKFRVGINSFYQTNKEIAILAYKEILKNINKDEIIFDLYSGIGTISLLAAKVAKYVFAADWSRSNHSDAMFNKKNNNVRNITFFNEDAFDALNKLKEKPDTIIVDPAREGLGRKVCERLLKFKPNKIIYLSCNPGTQASDFSYLRSKYKMEYAMPFDMFPQTHHIENLIVLIKK